MMIAEQFYTLQDTADRLGVSRNTIWRWVKADKLQAQKAGGVVFLDRRLVDTILEKATVTSARRYAL